MPQLFSYLTESKAFRNNDMARRYTSSEMAKICYAMFLSLELLYRLGYRKEVRDYASKSLNFPNFDKVLLSVTDLANSIAILRHAGEILNDKPIMVPLTEVRLFLRSLKEDTKYRHESFFFLLQNTLHLHDAFLSRMRRHIVDSLTIYPDDSKKYIDELKEYLKRESKDCDMIGLLIN